MDSLRPLSASLLCLSSSLSYLSDGILHVSFDFSERSDS